MIKVGIVGLTFRSGNKGCEALTYSFVNIIRKISHDCGKKIELYVIEPLPIRRFIRKRFNVLQLGNELGIRNYKNIIIRPLFYIDKCNKIVCMGNVKELDLIIDFTAGDSFTDIYGDDRFSAIIKLKSSLINKNNKYVLGSQTIGPFKNKNNEKIAKSIIENSYKVFVRDIISYNYVKEAFNILPQLTTDIAFFLPYDHHQRDIREKSGDEKIVIGFNPSGLLWTGGYTQNNQFELKTDYKKYCIEILNYIVSKPNYDVYLIPHVYSDDMEYPDNDNIAVKELLEIIPNLKSIGCCSSPMAIKSKISQMDCVVGARMHATIAAISSGVPVIPFSYSRKFEGLFDTLNYKIQIDGKDFNTSQAVEKTIAWLNDIDFLRDEIRQSNDIVRNLKEEMYSRYKELICHVEKK